MPRAATVNALPDDLLIRCLGHLSQMQRLRARQVCLRWRALCDAPQLQHSLSVEWLRCGNVPRRAQALLAHALRHGQHVRECKLMLSGSAETGAETMAVAGSSLVLCSGSLQSLSLRMTQPHAAAVSTAAWLPALRQLRRALLSVRLSELRLAGDLSGLSRCEALELHGWPLEVDAEARLPASLTRLVIGSTSRAEADVPAQVAALPRLARLKIDMRCSSSSLAAVAPKLSSVTRLRLSGALPPAAAPALTGLLHLHVQRWEPALAADHLQRMLQPLRQLTALVLDGGAFLHALPALAGLERLQRCYFRVGGQEELPDLELPEGPYLASLRWLGTGFRVLLNSMDTLASAPRLECLSIIEPLEEEPDLGGDGVMDLRTRDRRPALLVFRNGSCEHVLSFCDELNADTS